MYSTAATDFADNVWMFQHMIVDWSGRIQRTDFAPSALSEPARDFERFLTNSPKGFEWTIIADNAKPIMLRWRGWAGGIGEEPDTLDKLIGGRLEITRDGATEISLPLLRINNEHDAHEIRLHFLPSLCGCMGRKDFDPPFVVSHPVHRVVDVAKPVLVTVVNVPLERRFPLDDIEQSIAATYIRLMLAKYANK
jgi:hypothetical protein